MIHKTSTHIHFIGIGGIGMSGIAAILAQRGYKVSGCDAHIDEQLQQNLIKNGCSLSTHNNGNICRDTSITFIVYSTAITTDHPELVAARKRGIICIHRSLMLAELMRTKYSIAISGSHGKTTTTSLIAHMLMQAQLDPTLVIGGNLTSINSNAHNGSGTFLVAEADESDRSFLNLFPTLAVITNIDLEHLETYKNLYDVTQTFKHFLDRLPFYGKAIVCLDDPQVRSLLPLERSYTTYGLTTQADWTAQTIQHFPDYSTYEAFYKNEYKGSIHIAMPGIHNVLNSLAALAAGNEINLPFSVIAQALATFTGVDRRFTFKGMYQGAEVFDDYGHHPLEIKHTLETAQRKTRGKITMLFQPHRYTRTQKLWNDFVQMFAAAPLDTLIITDIFPASEAPQENITSQNLVASIQQANPTLKVLYAPLTQDFNELKTLLSSHVQAGDLLLLQGAGKVNKISAYLIAQ